MSTAVQGPAEPAGLRAFLTDPDPAPGEDPDGAPLAERTFYIDPEARGVRSRFVTAGGVQFNRAVPYRVPVEDLEPMARRRENLDHVRLELLKFHFTIRELPRGSSYETVRIRITLDPPHPLMQLRPRSDTAQTQQTRSFSQDVEPLLLKLLQLNLKYTSTTSVNVTESKPVVTALDLNAEGFGWTYQAQNGTPLSPGLRQTVAVLELGTDTDEISGVFDAEATVSRRLLGLVRHSSTVPVQPPVPFRIKL
ncbi:hypothetical protein [Streptacidiphilus melanogenes]|uniref:hypothetical protein n=1 Tax=Streptacidiphilus melanogenes TaxID=411235 RepID=UPI00126A008C|nr:hypothetical protein [Streptacidiphilus melanogenes]